MTGLRKLPSPPQEETPGGNRGIEPQRKQATMTSYKSTAPIDSAAMIRAYCPDWCESRTHGRDLPHTLSISGDGTRIVTHRSHQEVPAVADASVVLLREVQWTLDGTLVRKSDTFVLRETMLSSGDELDALAEFLLTLHRTMCAGEHSEATQ